MKTYKIIHNGSKFAGEKNDDLKQLEERLRKYALEDFSTTRKITNGLEVWGNFKTLSAVFKIELYAPELIKRFRNLIYRNFALSKMGKL